MAAFSALVVNKMEEQFSVDVKELTFDDLPPGDVLIRVAYSSVNYKDGLAVDPKGRIVKSYPFVPGIDLAGTVVSSENSRFREGDEVIVTSYGLGVSHFGGFSQYARVPSDWVVPLPLGLTMKEAMDHVVASTGKESEHEYLRHLGAKEIFHRADVSPAKIQPLDKQRWAGAVDPVGGKTLAYVLSTTQYGGSVAVSGLTGGGEVPATVYPFILRGINLLGIDSVECPMHMRTKIWERMASELKPKNLLDHIGSEINLNELPAVLSEILKGTIRGRTIVNVK